MSSQDAQSSFCENREITPSVADLLREAYDARQACDYESDMAEDEAMAKNAIANAQIFISEVKILPS